MHVFLVYNIYISEECRTQIMGREYIRDLFSLLHAQLNLLSNGKTFILQYESVKL
jgi:hypothetical protein